MKKALIFLLFINLLAAQIRPSDHGTVVAVYDGDTIKVRFDSGVERRVRLIGIDTPEIGETPLETPLEALLAKRFTFFYLISQRVKLTYEAELEDSWLMFGTKTDFLTSLSWSRDLPVFFSNLPML